MILSDSTKITDNIPEYGVSEFNDIINDHLRKEKKRILEKLNELAKIHSKSLKITLNIYNIVMLINYPKLKAELSERFDKLE